MANARSTVCAQIDQIGSDQIKSDRIDIDNENKFRKALKVHSTKQTPQIHQILPTHTQTHTHTHLSTRNFNLICSYNFRFFEFRSSRSQTHIDTYLEPGMAMPTKLPQTEVRHMANVSKYPNISKYR